MAELSDSEKKELLQLARESIEKHLARGERSMLDAFQSAAKQVAGEAVGVLVPFWRFYPSIESFLDTSVKKTIDQAKDNASLEQEFEVFLGCGQQRQQHSPVSR